MDPLDIKDGKASLGVDTGCRMDTTDSSWDSGIVEKETDVSSGGGRGGWREIEIARTASVEAARREDEEKNVFMDLEVDVDEELRDKVEGSPEGSDDFFFFGDDGYPSPNLPPLPPSPRPSRLSEVKLETIGETSTDTMEEEGLILPPSSWSDAVMEDPSSFGVTMKTMLETVGKTSEISAFSFDNIGETCTDDEILDPIDAFVESDGQVGEAIFEKELTLFAEELEIPIREEQSAEDLEFVASYFTFLTFAKVIHTSPCSSAAFHLHSTLNVLKEMVASCKKDSIGLKEVLKEPKKKAAEILLETFAAMKQRSIAEVNNLLDEAKKRLEKDLKVTDITFKDRVTATRLLIFVECLLKSYNSEKQIFLPTYLMSEAARERMVKKMKKHLTKLIESLGQKRNDSKWKKFSGGTVDRRKETREGGQALLDDLLRIACKSNSMLSSFIPCHYFQTHFCLRLAN